MRCPHRQAQKGRQTGRLTYRQASWQTDKNIGRLAGRDTDRQAVRHTHRERDCCGLYTATKLAVTSNNHRNGKSVGRVLEHTRPFSEHI